MLVTETLLGAKAVHHDPCIRSGPTGLEVFAIDDNGALNYWTNSTGAWEHRAWGGGVTGIPGCCGGHAFAQSTEERENPERRDRLVQWYKDPATGQVRKSEMTNDGTILGAPEALFHGGYLQVFASANGGELGHWYARGTWDTAAGTADTGSNGWGYAAWPGPKITGSPAPCITGDGVTVYAQSDTDLVRWTRAADGTIAHTVPVKGSGVLRLGGRNHEDGIIVGGSPAFYHKNGYDEVFYREVRISTTMDGHGQEQPVYSDTLTHWWLNTADGTTGSNNLETRDISGRPVAVLSRDRKKGHLFIRTTPSEVVAHGRNGDSLIHKTRHYDRAGAPWTTEYLGDGLIGDPAACAGPDGIHVVARVKGDKLKYWKITS